LIQCNVLTTFIIGLSLNKSIGKEPSISHDSFISVCDNEFADDYSIGDCIGQGGYGRVYKVENKSSKLIRAMKSNTLLI